MKRINDIKKMLHVFDANLVRSLLTQFDETLKQYRNRKWEACISKAGKFVEVVVKILGKHCHLTIPRGRQFKVAKMIDDLRKADPNIYDDSVRLLIPRASYLVYDISSNRGGRHHSDEIDPNKMDATIVVENMSWILSELIRYSHIGSIKPEQAKNMVEALMEKKYPLFEEIDGRIYVNKMGLSATEVALLIMSFRYPLRINKNELINTLKRHGFKVSNAKVAISRLSRFVDDDGSENYKLRGLGRDKAEKIIDDINKN